MFGYIMFNNTHGNSVDKILIPYTHDKDVAPYSWVSAVLAATYRGLCDGCTKTDGEAILTGCPLVLQLWSYEGIAVGCPIISHEPYDEAMYGAHEDDRPTMGTVWCCRQVRWQKN